MASDLPLRRGAALRGPPSAAPQPGALADMRTPKPGDVLLIGAAASVQFAGRRELRLRLVSVDAGPTYHGWIWLTGHVLDEKGLAVAKREVYVQRAGVRLLVPVRPPRLPVDPVTMLAGQGLSAQEVSEVRRQPGHLLTGLHQGSRGDRLDRHRQATDLRW
ncbi:hypothetical protein [Micromonospora mirobrigensis]|uniref:hypothetical protein n=1 Tax=Micromonospora mirobrigensis TaxID=262898 RepID=UPI001FDFA3FA|nr:hypothetical protein [Micromonospora mirobrigensis]